MISQGYWNGNQFIFPYAQRPTWPTLLGEPIEQVTQPASMQPRPQENVDKSPSGVGPGGDQSPNPVDLDVALGYKDAPPVSMNGLLGLMDAKAVALDPIALSLTSLSPMSDLGGAYGDDDSANVSGPLGGGFGTGNHPGETSGNGGGVSGDLGGSFGSGGHPGERDGTGGSSGDSSGGVGDGPGSGAPGGPACCFVGSALITMADGATKRIDQINVGDVVSDTEGGTNTVLKVKETTLGSRALVSYNNALPYMSSDHPVLTEAGWMAQNPIPENFDFEVSRIEIGDTIHTKDGLTLVEKINIEDADDDLPLFDLTLDGNHKYYANGLVVHNCYTGGLVSQTYGPDPDGPDDGHLPMQTGEYVVKKSAVKKYGRGLLDMINEGKVPKAKLKGLLGC